jgi:NAD(P)-dependent dehydrogenase (short-subunit alcohol dehydrogenase family)
MSPVPLSYRPDATALIVGVGLMGQHMASNILNWLDLKKLVIADHAETIGVGTGQMTLTDFAASVGAASGGAAEVVAETLDVTSEDEVHSLLERHGKVDYLMHTAGISPMPLTPPELLSK